MHSGQAVVVEGYMDALIPLQAGVNNVVATLGTSLTDRHVHMLSRYAREVVLVFDADTAGQAAADRGLEMFLAQRVSVRVATIPSGKDPCDYVLAEGAEAATGRAAAPVSTAGATRSWPKTAEAGAVSASRRARRLLFPLWAIGRIVAAPPRRVHRLWTQAAPDEGPSPGVIIPVIVPV